MAESYLGSGGRLKGGPAPELVAAGYSAEIAHGPLLAHALSIADLSHAVVLAENGALSAERASGLIDGLLSLHEIPGDEFPWDAGLGDAFNSREHQLTERVGSDCAGWLSAGRPRREAFRVALRFTAREQVRALHDAVVDIAAALVGHAVQHANALAADYTYLQPAQPTTVGHLLLAYVEPALRDAGRLRALHSTLDLSVAGAGGSAGSRWPTDRQRLADLLGCRGVVPHVRDAMWQTDVYVELLGAIAISAAHQSHIGQDFEIFASQEFGVIMLADQHSRASALMPQKRNPYALAVIREAAGAAAGDVAATLTTLHTGSARTDHFHALNGVVPHRLEHSIAVARLTGEVLSGMTIHPERLAEAAVRGFTVAADVADVVAQDGGLDYRRAHKVVGRAVRELETAGRRLVEITAQDLSDAASEVADGPVTIDKDALAAALDPAQCVLARLQDGSCAPHEVELLIARSREEIDDARAWSGAAQSRADEATMTLLDTARALTG